MVDIFRPSKISPDNILFVASIAFAVEFLLGGGTISINLPLAAFFMMTVNLTMSRNRFRFYSVTVSVASAVAFAAIGSFAIAFAITGSIFGFLLTIGDLIWYGRKDNQNYCRFLAIISFPFFCSFPIMVIFATIYLLRFLSWKQTLLIWLISFGTCTGLWLYGQDKERKAKNPLKGILDIYN